MLDWNRLLSARRPASREADPVDPARSPFQKDFDRIVFSSAFRRMQDKTQVHPLSGNDYVRTRLTHSMEVASVGRSLGAGVGYVIARRRNLDQRITPAEFGHIVSAACLAHDIGNPPFGHMGEELIARWFAESHMGQRMVRGLPREQQGDFLKFEGNAQGFRILTALQNWQGDGGFRLTAATLGTFTKYPRFSATPPGDKTDAGSRKFGIMHTEAAIWRWVARETGLPEVRPGQWLRHPLCYLVEAADDICYTIVDVEDGFKVGRLTFREAEEMLMAVAGTLKRYREINAEERQIAYLRAKAIGRLIEQTIAVFLATETSMLEGRWRQSLLDDVPLNPVMQHIGRITAEKVFVRVKDYPGNVPAAQVLARLMDHYMTAGIPGQPEAARLSGYSRIQAVTDYVSGMTDRFAVEQYEQLERRRRA